MITLKLKNINTKFNQDEYDKLIDSIDIHNLSCTCNSHNLIKHGTYIRKLIIEDNVIDIKIIRLRCKDCGKTHALLVSLIVPYQKVALNIQIRILKNDNLEKLMIDNPLIDELIINRVKSRYKKRYQKWMSLNKYNFEYDLIKLSFDTFKSNFMQIKYGSYNLFCLPT